MTELEKLIARCWSSVVARGQAGDACDVAEEMRLRGSTVEASEVARRLTELRAAGRLP